MMVVSCDLCHATHGECGLIYLLNGESMQCMLSVRVIWLFLDI